MKESKEVKRIKKGKSGITLIALVITIIVLLILAGISIMMLTGDNSILNQATNAKNNTIEGQEKEAINVAYHGVLTDNLGSPKTGAKWKEELEKQFEKNGEEATVSSDGKKITFRKTQHVYTLDIERGTIKGPKVAGGKSTLAELYESGELKIGDYVNYDAKTGATQATETSNQTDNGLADQQFVLSNYTGSWRVLGAENGQVILIATDNVGPEGEEFTLEEEGHTYKLYYLRGRSGYQNAVSELKKVCQLYGQGQYADKAKTRSVNIDDINKITGYNPSTAKYGEGEWNEYGNQVTYKFKGATSIYASSTNGKTNTFNYGNTSLSYNTFWWYNNGWQSLTNAGAEETNITTLESTYYYYYPETLTDNEDSTAETGIAHTSPEYDMLFGTDSAQMQGYWLGSQCVGTGERNAHFYLRFVGEGSVGCTYLADSCDSEYYDGCPVRPAVYLESEVCGTKEENGTWTLSE